MELDRLKEYANKVRTEHAILESEAASNKDLLQINAAPFELDKNDRTVKKIQIYRPTPRDDELLSLD